MSKPPNRPKLTGPDGASPVRAFVTTGVARTSKGYALVTVAVALDGSVTMSMGNSQEFPQYISAEHAKAAHRNDLNVQAGK